MYQKTTKYVASIRLRGVEYYDNGERTADGTPYLTTCGQSAHGYNSDTSASRLPAGFTLKRITYLARVSPGIEVY